MPALRWGVVGAGGFVRGTMAPAMVADPYSELVAVASRSRESGEAFGREFGVPHRYVGVEAMLEDPHVDAVYIAIPNSEHASVVVLAAQMGKHVFCEKPLAINAADAAAAVRACERNGVKLGVNFHNRYLPWVRHAAELVAAGRIGEVQSVEVEASSGPRTYDNWRARPELAGLGTVHNVGVHVFDFLRVILGVEPVEVNAVLDPSPDTGLVEMMAMVTLRFANGALGYVNCNERILMPRNEITIQGTAGRIVGRGFTRSRVDGEMTIDLDAETRTMSFPAPDAHALCLSAFVAAVREGRDPSPSGWDGLRSAELCEAIAVSAATRATVTVPVESGPGSVS